MPTISHFYGIIIVMYLRDKEFILKYKGDLLAMWQTGKYKRLPPLE